MNEESDHQWALDKEQELDKELYFNWIMDKESEYLGISGGQLLLLDREWNKEGSFGNHAVIYQSLVS